MSAPNSDFNDSDRNRSRDPCQIHSPTALKMDQVGKNNNDVPYRNSPATGETNQRRQSNNCDESKFKQPNSKNSSQWIPPISATDASAEQNKFIPISEVTKNRIRALQPGIDTKPVATQVEMQFSEAGTPVSRNKNGEIVESSNATKFRSTASTLKAVCEDEKLNPKGNPSILVKTSAVSAGLQDQGIDRSKLSNSMVQSNVQTAKNIHSRNAANIPNHIKQIAYQSKGFEHQQASAATGPVDTSRNYSMKIHPYNAPKQFNRDMSSMQQKSTAVKVHHESSANATMQDKFMNHASPSHMASTSGPGGHGQGASRSAPDVHHNTTAARSEQHGKTKTSPRDRKKDKAGKIINSQPEVIEKNDNNRNFEQLVQHVTVAIANQFGPVDDRKFVMPNAGSQDLQFHQNDSRKHSEKKRSLPDNSDHGVHKRSIVHRNSLPIVEAHTATIPSGSSHSHYTTSNGPGQMAHNSSFREVNVNDAMNLALDETIDPTSNTITKSNGRPIDTPMTYLVRQLLGQVEVRGDEPPVVLAPHAVKDASQKIVLVINKVIEILVMKAGATAQVQLREAETRMRALEDILNAKDRENLVAHFESQQQNIMVLKSFAEEKCTQLAESNKTIETLRIKLAQYEQSTSTASTQNISANTENNATMRRLINQLDDNMSTIQSQKKEIETLRAVIARDTATLQKKREMKTFLMETFQIDDTKTDTSSNSSNRANENQEVVSLINEVKALQAALSAERQQSENTLKAYMKAAVHALKMQRKDELIE